VLRNISVGWVATPVIAAVISYIALYFVQNVFEQPVYLAADTIAQLSQTPILGP
jgi:PiT family inorganic phosphate transporter